MPFYSGQLDQMELYTEVLDQILSVINQYGALCPLYILGDFNAQLPYKSLLHKHWSGYNKNSRILYEFVADNNLRVLDLESAQPLACTYFCYTSEKYTWIDHCLAVGHNSKNLKCVIFDHDVDNVSDHLPLCLKTEIFLPAMSRHREQHSEQYSLNSKRW